MHHSEPLTAIYVDLHEVTEFDLGVDWFSALLPRDGRRMIARAYGDAALLARLKGPIASAGLMPVTVSAADAAVQLALDVMTDLQQSVQAGDIWLVGVQPMHQLLIRYVRRQGRQVTAIGSGIEPGWSDRSVVVGRREVQKIAAVPGQKAIERAVDESGNDLTQQRLEQELLDELRRAAGETAQPDSSAATQVTAAMRERLSRLQRDLLAYQQDLGEQLAVQQAQLLDHQAGMAMIEQWSSQVHSSAAAERAARWRDELRALNADSDSTWAAIARRMIWVDGGLATLERLQRQDGADGRRGPASDTAEDPDERIAAAEAELQARAAELERETAERIAAAEAALQARAAGLERAAVERMAAAEAALQARSAELEREADERIAAAEAAVQARSAELERTAELMGAAERVAAERITELERTAANAAALRAQQLLERITALEQTLPARSETPAPAANESVVEPAAAAAVTPAEPPAPVAAPAAPAAAAVEPAEPSVPATAADLQKLASHYNSDDAKKPKPVQRPIVLPVRTPAVVWPTSERPTLPKTPAEEFEQLAASCADHATAVRHWVLRERGAIVDPVDEGYLHDDAFLAFCDWKPGHYQVLEEEREFWRRAAGAFDAASVAARGMSVVLSRMPNNKAYLENGLKLAAEAQSALRALTLERKQAFFSTQLKMFKAVREALPAKTFIDRHLRQEDLADPADWKERLRRIRSWVVLVDDAADRPKLIKQFMSLLEPAKTADAVDWQELDEIASRLKQPALSERHRRELQQVLRKQAALVRGNLRRNRHLAHLIRLLQLNLNAGEELDAREQAAGMTYGDDTTRIAEDDARFNAVEVLDAGEDYDAYTRAARELLRGQVMLVIGGDTRPDAEEKLRAVFEPRELIWVHTVGNSRFEIEHLIAREEVRAVFLAIRWVSHAVANKTAAWCRKYNRPLVRLPTGYNVGTVAYRLVTQVSGRIADNG
jgi:hypothetical protein